MTRSSRKESDGPQWDGVNESIRIDELLPLPTVPMTDEEFKAAIEYLRHKYEDLGLL